LELKKKIMTAITALESKIKATLEKGASISDLNSIIYTAIEDITKSNPATTSTAPTTTTAPKTDSSTAATATTAKTNSAPIATPPPKVNSVIGTVTTTTVNKTPSANVNSVTTPKVNLATVPVSSPNVNSAITATTTATTTTASPIRFILTPNNITAPSQTGTNYDNKYRIILKRDSTLCISARISDKHIIITTVNTTDPNQIWYKLNYITPKRSSKLVNLYVLKNALFCEIIRIGTTVDNTHLVEENGAFRDSSALFSCSTGTGFSPIKVTGNSNQCLDVIGNVVDGASVFVNPANNSDTQQWEFQSA